MTFITLLLVFADVGLFSFGGGYAALTLISQQVVTIHAWITAEEFADIITIAEMTPGPIALNAATFVGVKLFGPMGGLCASLAFVFPAVVLISIFCWGYSRFSKNVFFNTSLQVLRPAVTGIIVSAAVTLIFAATLFNGDSLSFENIDIVGTALFAAALICIRLTKKISPVIIMMITGLMRLGIEAVIHRT